MQPGRHSSGLHSHLASYRLQLESGMDNHGMSRCSTPLLHKDCAELQPGIRAWLLACRWVQACCSRRKSSSIRAMACDPSGTLALLPRFVGPLQPPPGFEGSDAQALLRLARLVALVPVLDSRWVAQTAQTLLRDHLVALPDEPFLTLGKLPGQDCGAEGPVPLSHQACALILALATIASGPSHAEVVKKPLLVGTCAAGCWQPWALSLLHLPAEPQAKPQMAPAARWLIAVPSAACWGGLSTQCATQQLAWSTWPLARRRSMPSCWQASSSTPGSR